MATAGSKRRLAVPRQDAEQLLGMACTMRRSLVTKPSFLSRMIGGPDGLAKAICGVLLPPSTQGCWSDLCEKLLRAVSSPSSPNHGLRICSPRRPRWRWGWILAICRRCCCARCPNQASFLQRVGRAGRRDGNALTTTLADGNSPHDLYFFAETQEMLSGGGAARGVLAGG